MNLYHFSEEADIEKFVPRRMSGDDNRKPAVWAIDEFHAPHYYFPRECPRICIWPEEQTSAADRARFFGHTGAERIISIESGWLEQLRTTVLYRYTFEAEGFSIYDRNAGYYISAETVAPLKVDRLDNLLERIAATHAELRITPTLKPMKESVLASSVSFSMIRMRNAIL